MKSSIVSHVVTFNYIHQHFFSHVQWPAQLNNYPGQFFFYQYSLTFPQGTNNFLPILRKINITVKFSWKGVICHRQELNPNHSITVMVPVLPEIMNKLNKNTE
ncbi:hypothetical protein ACF0H5_015680 [Mactra antiquata]